MPEAFPLRAGYGLDRLLEEIVEKRAALMAERNAVDDELNTLRERGEMVKAARERLWGPGAMEPDAYAAVRRMNDEML